MLRCRTNPGGVHAGTGQLANDDALDMIAAAGEPIPAGTTLGHYVIRGALGMGGMGEVYEAEDTRLHRRVALKVVRRDVASDPVRRARLESEASAAAMLNHPHIVTVYSLEEHDGVLFIAMELIDGSSLAEMIPPQGLPLDRLLAIAIELADALNAAHGRGVVHRDLKPANVMITRDGAVKVLDFGLSQIAVDEAGGRLTTETLTVDHRLVGTVPYMSPEQIEGQPADKRSDIFSLGVILFEMATGQRPFNGHAPLSTLTSILKDPAPFAGAVNSSVPDAVSRIIDRCLAKEPARRTQAAADLRNQLEDLQRMLESGAWVPASARRTPGRWRMRRSRLTIGIVIITLAALGGTVTFLAGRSIPAALRDVSFTPLSYRQEEIFRALFEPDGRSVVFSAALSGTDVELFTMTPELPEPRSLGVRNAQLLSVSSKYELAILTDAKFLGHRLFDGTLARMPVNGGAPRKIIEHVREADWSPDGESLAIIHDVNGRDRLEYPIGNVLYEASGYLSDPRVSPAGDRVAFFEHPVKFDDRGAVAVIDRARRKSTLAEGYWGLEGLAWSADGKEVLFSGGPGYQQFKVYAVSLTGRLRQALESAGGLTVHDVASNGRWLATRDDIRYIMMVKGPNAREEVDLSWLDFSVPQRLSSTGRKLLFTEKSGVFGDNYAVGLRDTDGSPVIRLGEGQPADLSPDEKLVVAIVPGARQTLVLYAVGAGEPRRLDPGPIQNYRTAVWLPDGRRILACGSEVAHAQRCYVQDIDGGSPRPITPDNTGEALVAPDGRRLIARRGGVSSLSSTTTNAPELYSLDGGASRPVPGLTPDDSPIRWSADGRSLIVAHGTLPARIERVFLDTGRRELIRVIGLANMPGAMGISNIIVADDPNVYAYAINRQLSQLFILQGAH
jgi:serine/threonine protein kinase/Tol biopolymer transport system component